MAALLICLWLLHRIINSFTIKKGSGNKGLDMKNYINKHSRVITPQFPEKKKKC